MAKSVNPNRWFSGWRADAAPPPIDAADQGTAFGLELSLQELEYEPPPAEPAPRRPGWVARMADRRKAPT